MWLLIYESQWQQQSKAVDRSSWAQQTGEEEEEEEEEEREKKREEREKKLRLSLLLLLLLPPAMKTEPTAAANCWWRQLGRWYFHFPHVSRLSSSFPSPPPPSPSSSSFPSYSDALFNCPHTSRLFLFVMSLSVGSLLAVCIRQQRWRRHTAKASALPVSFITQKPLDDDTEHATLKSGNPKTENTVHPPSTPHSFDATTLFFFLFLLKWKLIIMKNSSHPYVGWSACRTWAWHLQPVRKNKSLKSHWTVFRVPTHYGASVCPPATAAQAITWRSNDVRTVR